MTNSVCILLFFNNSLLVTSLIYLLTISLANQIRDNDKHYIAEFKATQNFPNKIKERIEQIFLF